MSDQLFLGNVDFAHCVIRLERDGWRVRINHRHEYDRASTLRESEYSALTLGEMLGVIEATLCAPPQVI